MVAMMMGSLVGIYTIDSIDSMYVRALDGILVGAAIGVMAYMDKINTEIMYVVAAASSLLFLLSGIVFWAASSSASITAAVLMALIIPLMVFWALTRP